MPYYALPTPSPPRDYPCRRTLAHSSQGVHMPCLLISMHGGSQVRGSRQSIFNSELEDSLFKDSIQVSGLLIRKFHVLCCCLIDNCNTFEDEIQSMFVLECIFRDVQRHGLPATPTVALPNRAVGGKSRAIRLLAKSCLARARAGFVQQHAQRNNPCQPRNERMSWLNCFAKKWALC